MDKLLQTLKAHGQEHVWAFAAELSDAQRRQLAGQLQAIDWEAFPGWVNEYVRQRPKTDLPPNLQPAPFCPAVPQTPEQADLYERARRTGEDLLRQGRVAAFTVAGGQGTRLGFDGPKGSFPIGPVSGKTLFQWFAESLLRHGERYGRPIPWYIMTSQGNDRATRDFFAEHRYFGMAREQVTFFTQGMMPSFATDGKLLLAAKDSLSLSPDGHGGSLMAMRRSGALADMHSRGIVHISYFQVDNPLVPVVNPLFIGLHHLAEAEMSNRMLAKNDPFEKLGCFCTSGGKLYIIEYSDLPKELALQLDAAGQLRYIAGSPAIHVIRRDFVERLTAGGRLLLPFHRADKKIPYIDARGELVKPETPNGVKLETFVFDALPLARKTLVAEGVREDEFGPVKNPDGVDSVVSCRRLLQEKFARWLAGRGLALPRDARGELALHLEISPRAYVTEEDFAGADLSVYSFPKGSRVTIP